MITYVALETVSKETENWSRMLLLIFFHSQFFSLLILGSYFYSSKEFLALASSDTQLTERILYFNWYFLVFLTKTSKFKSSFPIVIIKLSLKKKKFDSRLEHLIVPFQYCCAITSTNGIKVGNYNNDTKAIPEKVPV